eukprot:6181418-Pleurochrysis_carterae.AAC.6
MSWTGITSLSVSRHDQIAQTAQGGGFMYGRQAPATRAFLLLCMRAVLDLVLYTAYTFALCNAEVFLCMPGHRTVSTRGRPGVRGPYVASALWMLSATSPYKLSRYRKRHAEKQLAC